VNDPLCPPCREALADETLDYPAAWLPPDHVALVQPHDRCGVKSCLCPACWDPGRDLAPLPAAGRYPPQEW
jgi:hypothetical protein